MQLCSQFDQLVVLIDVVLSYRFSFDDKDHTYTFGVCVKANDNLKDDEGFVQINKNTTKAVIIGRTSDVDLEGTRKFLGKICQEDS